MKLLFKVAPELINSIDSYGNTPTHYASKYGNCDTLKFLLKHNPKLYIKNYKGKTAIDVAYDEDIIEIFGDYVARIKKNLQSINKRNKATMDTTGGTGGDLRMTDTLHSDRKSYDNSHSQATFKAQNPVNFSKPRKSQDETGFLQTISNPPSQSPPKIQRPQLQLNPVAQRRKSNDPNLVLGLMSNKHAHQPLYSTTKQPMQPNTDRGHYGQEDNQENLYHFSKAVGKHKVRSRNSCGLKDSKFKGKGRE